MVGLLKLDSGSETPLYRQLYEQIRLAIQNGSFSDGYRLPPTRELAGKLGLNRTTISAAYTLLESDGLIEGRVGRGSFVKALALAENVDGTIISFASSRPAGHEFPLVEFQAACRDVISGPVAGSILQLGSPLGYAPLRRHLMEESYAEGCARASDQILITSGCQQAFDLIQRVLARPGSTVVVEDPVYHGVRQVFSRDGVRLVGVPISRDGIALDELARTVAAARPALLIVTPNFQNPTGVTMPIGSRLRLLEIAREFNVTIVENDIYGFLRYEGDNVPTLKQLDDTGRVILLRSFSKIAFPGLRVGWVVAPAEIVAQLAEARQWCDLHTDHLSQAILLRFSESGNLRAHLERVRLAGAARLRATLEALEEHFPPGSEFTHTAGGMNLWISLPAPLDAGELLRRAEREHVTYLPGEHFLVSRREPGTLRLSFGSLTPEKIREGIAILGRIFTEELGQGRTPARFESVSALV